MSKDTQTEETQEKETVTDEVNNFLDAIPKDGEMPKDQVEPPAESSPEKTEEPPVIEEGAEKPKEDVPFHKHPRWVRLREENKRILAEKEAWEKRFSDLESKISKSSESQIPQWFLDRFGTDPATYEAYMATTKQEKAELKREILAEIKAEQSSQETKAKEMEQWVEDSIQDLQDEGEEFDPNALKKVLIEYTPTDEAGNISFRKGLALLRQLNAQKEATGKQVLSAKKEIAASTTSSNRGEKTTGRMTLKELRSKSFQDLAQ